MLQNAEMIFSKLNQDYSTKQMMKIIDEYDESYLIVVVMNEINFVGEVSYRNKESIKNALKLQEIYEVGNNLFRMVLNDSIYMYKEFGAINNKVLIGMLIKKTSKNRLDVMNMQMNFLLQRSEAW